MTINILFQDETWALLEMNDIKLALVTPGQHEPHLAVKVDSEEELKELYQVKQEDSECTPINTHRDGSVYFYQKAIDNIVIEWIFYPDSDNYISYE